MNSELFPFNFLASTFEWLVNSSLITFDGDIIACALIGKGKMKENFGGFNFYLPSFFC